jgi:hypothetical protein
MGSAAPLSAAPFDAGALSAQTPASDGAAGATDTGEGGASAQFRACQVDSDCVAVQRVGCCHNGWLEAVATSQQGAYTHSFVCPKPHPCPMYVVRDTRVPKCDADTHLCTMVRTQQP